VGLPPLVVAYWSHRRDHRPTLVPAPSWSTAAGSLVERMVTTAGMPQLSWATTVGVRRSMLANRSSDTGPERRLRSELHRLGLRFRKAYVVRAGELRTRPDVVFTRARVAVFLDGCFWHRCPEHGSDPKANGAYWNPKLKANVRRDRLVDRTLAASGWLVIRVWEHEPAAAAAARVALQVASRHLQATDPAPGPHPSALTSPKASVGSRGGGKAGSGDPRE
jgi:DNA mismatch endonuclease, patch repair protein